MSVSRKRLQDHNLMMNDNEKRAKYSNNNKKKTNVNNNNNDDDNNNNGLGKPLISTTTTTTTDNNNNIYNNINNDTRSIITTVANDIDINDSTLNAPNTFANIEHALLTLTPSERTREGGSDESPNTDSIESSSNLFVSPSSRDSSISSLLFFNKRKSSDATGDEIYSNFNSPSYGNQHMEPFSPTDIHLQHSPMSNASLSLLSPIRFRLRSKNLIVAKEPKWTLATISFNSNVSQIILSHLYPLDVINLNMTCRRWRHEITHRYNKIWQKTLKKYEEYAIFNTLVKQDNDLKLLPIDSIQSQVDGRMRAVLVDWVIKISLRYGHHIHTQFLAIRLLDSLLSCARIRRHDFQLVGMTALLLACKLEEQLVLSTNDLVNFCDGLYSKAQIVYMESAMLASLKFRLNWPTLISFIKFYLDLQPPGPQASSMMYFLAEESLLHEEFVPLSVLKLSTAIYCLSCFSFHVPFETILLYSKLKYSDLIESTSLLLNMHENVHRYPTLQEIREAYSSQHHHHVALRQPQRSFLTLLTYSSSLLNLPPHI